MGSEKKINWQWRPIRSHYIVVQFLIDPINFKKLQFYSLFKHDYKISSYLDLTRNSTGRKDLVKIRLSNRKLMI